MESKTVKVHLLNGDPRGIRMAEMTGHKVGAILIPRASVKSARSVDGIQKCGVVFFLGHDDSLDRPSVKIKSSYSSIEEIVDHHRRDEEWSKAVALIPTAGNFTMEYAEHVEYRYSQKVEKKERVRLKTKESIQEYNISEQVSAEAEESIGTIVTLLQTLNCKNIG
jgi:hypothetical protein